MKIRTYSELIRIPTFEERYEYLKLAGQVGEDTFGFDRYLNQQFYRSAEWKRIRNYVIARDYGRDLAMEDHEIFDQILIHHMNPITKDDIIHSSDILLNPEYLITTCKRTHNAIHYGTEELVSNEFIERKPGDTKLW